MKVPIAGLLLLLQTVLFAQTNPLMFKVEGDWKMTQNGQPIGFAQWEWPDDCGISGKTFRVLGADTLPESILTLQILGETTQLIFKNETVLGAKPQFFKEKKQAARNEVLWQNMDSLGQPAQIRFVFYNDSNFDLQIGSQTTRFQEKKSLRLRTEIGLQMGASLNKFRSPVHLLAGQSAEYDIRPGTEVAVSLGLRSRNMAIGWHLEAGLTRRAVGVHSSWTSPEQITYTRDGVYHLENYYLAFIPKAYLGKKQQFSPYLGFFTSLSHQTTFNGLATSNGTGAPDPRFADPTRDVSKEIGLVYGLDWQLPGLSKFAVKPGLFLRGTSGMGDKAVRAVSAGLRFSF